MWRKEDFKATLSKKHLMERLNHYFILYPKHFIIAMIVTICFGIVYLLSTKNIRQSKEKKIDEIFNMSLPDTTEFTNPTLGFEHLGEILELERELNNIMKKDKLTKEDSIFMRELNNKLNKMIEHGQD